MSRSYQMRRHVPARSNLCKAQGLDIFHAATVGMRLEIVGTATGPAEITVCEDPTHRLRRIE